MGVIRTFISLPLPAGIRAKLADFALSLRSSYPGAKWEGADKLHLTLRFLGSTDEGMLPAILGSMDAAAREVGPFTLTVEGFGGFPSLRRPRVLWAGCRDESGSLLRLRGALDRMLDTLGIGREERAFHPHVTLARIPGDGVVPHLTSDAKVRTFEAHSTPVTEIFLMQSVLRSEGAEHTVIGASRLT